MTDKKNLKKNLKRNFRRLFIDFIRPLCYVYCIGVWLQYAFGANVVEWHKSDRDCGLIEKFRLIFWPWKKKRPSGALNVISVSLAQMVPEVVRAYNVHLSDSCSYPGKFPGPPRIKRLLFGLEQVVLDHCFVCHVSQFPILVRFSCRSLRNKQYCKLEGNRGANIDWHIDVFA